MVLSSSTVPLKPAPNLVDYVAAKAGIIGVTKSAALELAALSNRVNSVHPSTVDPPMLQNPAFRKLFVPALDQPTRDDMGAVTHNFHALLIPWVDAVDIANAIVFLFSDEARHITGVQLPVDCGNLLL